MKGVRQRAMQELLRQHGQLTVLQLSERLEVSEATIRRDLQDLSGVAGLQRMHGGATLSDGTEPLVIARQREDPTVKMALAERARQQVHPGATIYIGSGSTTAVLAECLLQCHELTVITNAQNVALELASAPGINIVMTGGICRKGEMSLVGPIAEHTVRQAPFEIAFISVNGISADSGMSAAFAPEASIDRVVLEVAPRLVVLAEADKLGRVAPIFVGPATAMDLLVTDADPDGEEYGRLVSLGIPIAEARSVLAV